MNIENYENYIIYENGKIYNTKTKIWLKPCKNQDGYLQLKLCKDGKQKHFRLHRLLAKTFIPNPNNLECVDHINGVRDDNRLENLRWYSKENNCNNRKNNPKILSRNRLISGNYYKEYSFRKKYYKNIYYKTSKNINIIRWYKFIILFKIKKNII
tara:strand:- start:58 stop:522 length:465 start_codon:yes stop_codon:yes gene_type:complete